MIYKHYIKIDSHCRIIDAFTTAQRQPEAGDIYLHDGGPAVEIFPRQPDLSLSFPARGVEVWLLAYDNGQPRWRTEDELEADMPPAPSVPDTGTRLADAEADIQTLLECINIIVGG